MSGYGGNSRRWFLGRAVYYCVGFREHRMCLFSVPFYSNLISPFQQLLCCFGRYMMQPVKNTFFSYYARVCLYDSHKYTPWNNEKPIRRVVRFGWIGYSKTCSWVLNEIIAIKNYIWFLFSRIRLKYYSINDFPFVYIFSNRLNNAGFCLCGYRFKIFIYLCHLVTRINMFLSCTFWTIFLWKFFEIFLFIYAFVHINARLIFVLFFLSHF